jgi:3-hydroxyacyl-CoA dehydrogenase/enoyl-CoA hydratase/3-hydroxybutyryl-CoA epimerase
MDIFVLDPTQDPVEDTVLSPLPLRKHTVHKTPCFQKEVDGDGICWLTFDTPNASANVWNSDTLDEFDCHIEELHRDSSIRALVIRSAKERVYIAGADLKTILAAPQEELNTLLSLGQDVFTHLESLRIPKIAAIHGACVGGGFEMTLACDWRIASDSDATRVGLPETMLGLVPAWGGCTRLSRLIGLPRATDLIVRGKLLKPGHAKHLGLVDEVTPVEHLVAAAKKRALSPTRVKRHHFHFTQIWPVPQLLRWKAKHALWRKVPWTKHATAAPAVAIDVITRGAAKSFEHSLQLEQAAIRDLARTPATRRFIQLFFRKETASKKLPASAADATARAVTNATVIGAGVMGSGIAYAIATKGPRVLVIDSTPNALAAGVGRVRKLLHDGVKHRAFTKTQARDALDRMGFTHDKTPLKRMDLVIEAVFEDMAVKKALFADIASRCDEKTILATNTSALSVTEMAREVPHPERVIGLHFFNPAHLMPLVEIVTHEANTREVIATVVKFVQGLGKTPVLVKDRPGFVVNRILMPYLLGAVKLAEMMRDPWDLDDAMVNFGMPMGPLRLLDEVGFDVALHVEKTLRAEFGDRIPQTTLLKRMVDAGMLGRKNGRGFYSKVTPKSGLQANPDVLPMLTPREYPPFRTQEEMATHLNGLMQAEAQRCLDEGVAASAADIELAMTLGTGYPPFRNLFNDSEDTPAS